LASSRCGALASVTNHLGCNVSAGAFALLLLDGAGWHDSPKLVVPDNIVLLPLPAYAPDLNAIENVWDNLRSNYLSNAVWQTYDAIVDA